MGNFRAKNIGWTQYTYFYFIPHRQRTYNNCKKDQKLYKQKNTFKPEKGAITLLNKDAINRY